MTNIIPIPKTPSIPDIMPNYPVLNTFLRSGILLVAGMAVAAMVAWMNAKGFNAGIVESFLPWATASALIAIATFIYSLIASNAKAKTILALVEHVLEAAQTGQVPAEVLQIAPTSQKVLVAAVTAQQADPQKKLI